MPDNRRELGKASVWLPASALRCGTTSVTSISFDETAGLLLAGDEQGFIVFYEIYDTKTNSGSLDILKKIYENYVSEAELLAANSDEKLRNVSDFKQEQLLSDCKIYDYLQFNSIREVYRTKLVNETISHVYLMGSFFLVFIGTDSGSVYASSTDIRAPIFSKIEKTEATGCKGAVKGMDYGYYYLGNQQNGNLIVCLYVYYESGHILVIDISTMSVISYSIALGASKSVDGKEKILHPVNTMPVLNAAFSVLEKPTVEAYLYEQARIRNYLKGSLIMKACSYDSVESTTSSAANSRPQSSVQQQQSHLSQQLPSPPPEQQQPQTTTSGSEAVSPTFLQNQPKAAKRSFFGSFSRGNSTAPNNANPLPPAVANPASISSSTSSNYPQPPPPVSTSAFADKTDVSDSSKIKLIEFEELQVPRYLMFLSGSSLTTIALAKSVPINLKLTPQNTASFFASAQTKDICKKGETIITSNLFNIKDFNEDNDADDKPKTVPHLVCIDNEGWLRIISTKSRAPVHHANVLEGVIAFNHETKRTASSDEQDNQNDNDDSNNSKLYAGVLLSNGSCYLLQKGIMQYSSHLLFLDEEKHPVELLSDALPERAIPTSRELNKNLGLLHGREQLLANLKAQLKKRRSSVISLSAAPTDLYKVFQKNREQRTKDELLEGTTNPNSGNSPVNNAKATQAGAQKVKSELDQLKEGFAERGEKINRIALKMDDFKQSATTYKQVAKEQKEILAKRNSRWGLF
jgi:hypothetical protein